MIRRHNDSGAVALLMNFSEASQDLASVMTQFEISENYSIYGESGSLPEAIEPGQYILFQTVQ
ncbi:hypothetical protein D3C81_2278940 [compost metagenome]